MNKNAIIAAAGLVLAGIAHAADKPQTQPAAAAPAAAASAAPAAPRAMARLQSAAGANVAGTVSFRKVTGGVEVSVEIAGLTPGKHGFHIHELGDCSAADFSSAGPHFNPTGHPHAGQDAAQRHEGDLGNIEAGADGKATVTFIDWALDLEGPQSILGRGVIVHASPDDFRTQPTGNAGGRVACGIIGWAK